MNFIEPNNLNEWRGKMHQLQVNIPLGFDKSSEDLVCQNTQTCFFKK